jgi:hypothetical protein
MAHAGGGNPREALLAYAVAQRMPPTILYALSAVGVSVFLATLASML